MQSRRRKAICWNSVCKVEFCVRRPASHHTGRGDVIRSRCRPHRHPTHQHCVSYPEAAPLCRAVELGDGIEHRRSRREFRRSHEPSDGAGPVVGSGSGRSRRTVCCEGCIRPLRPRPRDSNETMGHSGAPHLRKPLGLSVRHSPDTTNASARDRGDRAWTVCLDVRTGASRAGHEADAEPCEGASATDRIRRRRPCALRPDGRDDVQPTDEQNR